MQFTRALTPAAPAYVTILTAAAAVGLLAMWPRAETETAFDARCEPWDSEAAAALSGLIGNRKDARRIRHAGGERGKYIAKLAR